MMPAIEQSQTRVAQTCSGSCSIQADAIVTLSERHHENDGWNYDDWQMLQKARRIHRRHC